VANTLGYLFVITISVAYKMTGSWFTAEAERKELERSRSEAELTNLKSQLNPHFLFNTLNNIYSLIAISPERAQEVVHELSRLLRYVLYESSQSFVTIEKDLDFVRNYVELMRIRLPGHVAVKMSLSYDSPDMLIAPLLFITPIENAFKHGVSNSKPSSIQIEIKASDKEVYCHIYNSYFPKNEQDKRGSGIGLANLHKRLELIYPGKYQFSYGRQENAYYCELKLCQLSLK
jgi:LytS/YehU family sensor histidine kinase